MRVPEIVLGFLLATAVWALLAVIGLPDAISSLKSWQTLIAATVALFAAAIAFHNTTRSLREAKQLEEMRRSRKHAAVRSVLPLALAQITDYAERTARVLDSAIDMCQGQALPRGSLVEDLAQPLPSETLRTLADFIEYSTIDVRLVEQLVAAIQIHDSRLRALVEHNRDPLRFVLKQELVGSIIDAACIHTAAGVMFGYARRRQDLLQTITWNLVGSTLLFQMPIKDRGYQAEVQRRESGNVKPFE